jgi:hypothetical protein
MEEETKGLSKKDELEGRAPASAAASGGDAPGSTVNLATPAFSGMRQRRSNKNKEPPGQQRVSDVRTNRQVSFQETNHTQADRTKEGRLWCIALAIFLIIVFTFGLGYLIIENVIVKSTNFGPAGGASDEGVASAQKNLWEVADSVFTSNLLNDEQFLVYVGFILFGTIEIAGIGLELFVWWHYLQTWDATREAFWKFSQFVFPLMVVTSIGMAMARNFLSMPLLVIGMWKMGFPETIMYLYLAMFGKKHSRIQRISFFLNGAGTVCHHSAAAFLVSMLLSGIYPPTRHVLNCALILVVQHWFVLLSYVNKWAYMVVELVLEAWFEWTVISDFWYLYEAHWTGALGTGIFLFAHWLYLAGAAAELFVPSSDGGLEDENIHVLGTKAFQRRSTNILGAKAFQRRSTMLPEMMIPAMMSGWGDSMEYSENEEDEPYPTGNNVPLPTLSEESREDGDVESGESL